MDCYAVMFYTCDIPAEELVSWKIKIKIVFFFTVEVDLRKDCSSFYNIFILNHRASLLLTFLAFTWCSLQGRKIAPPPTPLPPFPPSPPSPRPPALLPPCPLVFTWPCLDGCKLHCSRAEHHLLHTAFYPCASPVHHQSCGLEVQQTDAASGAILMLNVWLRSGPGHRCKCSSPQKTQTRMTLLAFWNKIQTHRRLKRMLCLLVVFCSF